MINFAVKHQSKHVLNRLSLFQLYILSVSKKLQRSLLRVCTPRSKKCNFHYYSMDKWDFLLLKTNLKLVKCTRYIRQLERWKCNRNFEKSRSDFSGFPLWSSDSTSVISSWSIGDLYTIQIIISIFTKTTSSTILKMRSTILT